MQIFCVFHSYQMNFDNDGDDADNKKKRYFFDFSWELQISMETENNHGAL